MAGPYRLGQVDNAVLCKDCIHCKWMVEDKLRGGFVVQDYGYKEHRCASTFVRRDPIDGDAVYVMPDLCREKNRDLDCASFTPFKAKR